MATTSKYVLLTSPGSNFIDFQLTYGTLTLDGEEIKYLGSSAVDAVFVHPGMTFDFTSAGGGVDKIYLSGNFADYAKSFSGSTVSLTRNVGGKTEAVSVIGGSGSSNDTLIFADGSVSSLATINFLKGTASAPVPTGETSLAPNFPTTLNATAKVVALNAAGETFALASPGMSLKVLGGSGVDTVYIKSGTTVDASGLGGGNDLVYFTGNWADYTKSISGSTMVFTRVLGGDTERVTVAAGTGASNDKLIFADGSAPSNNIKTAFAGNPSVALSAVSGFDGATVTPGVTSSVTTINVSTAPNLSGQSVISGKATANASVLIAIDPDNNSATSNSFTYTATADSNGDYSLNLATATPTSGTASFVAGTASVSVTQTVSGGASPATVITLPVSTATTYSASIAGDHVTEGDNAVFTVTRSGDTSGAGTVVYSTQNGTATAGSDYTAAISQTLSFAAGETTKTVTVATVDDTIVEGNETLSLVLSNPTGGTLGVASATATIVDNEGALFSISGTATGVSFSEGVGTYTLTVSRSGLTTGTDTVVVSSGGGTATAGADYTALNQTITFAAGETSKTVTITVVDDTMVEGNETFVVQLSNASTGALIEAANASVTATIQDNEVAVISLDNTATGLSFSEGAGTATFSLTRSGLTTNAVTVVVQSGGGTATAGAGSDYDAVNQTVSFAAGETAKTVTVTIHDDTLVEGNETFNLQLSNPAGGTLIDAAKASVTATIVDNEGAVFSLANAATGVSFSEGVGSQTFTVTRGGLTTGAASVVALLGGGTATAGSDYTATSQTLSFSAGENSKTFTVAINDDALVEGNETFNVQLTGASAGALVDAASASLMATIQDNEAAVISLDNAATGVSFSEGAGTATFSLTRSGLTTNAVTVVVQSGGGTATPGVGNDYTTVNQTVSFAAGETTKTVTVALNDDSLLEGNETFNLQLSNPTGGALIASSASKITATILDNDQSVWSVAGNASVSEGAGSLIYTVTRTGATGSTATIVFSAAGGTATAGSDFTAITGQTLTFAAGESSQTVAVALNDDTLAESDETVVATISNAGAGTLNTATATATILDNEQPNWSIAGGTAGEGAGSLAYTVTRSGSVNATATIVFTTAGGTATAGSDYTAVNQTLTFAAGETSKAVAVAINDDTLAEGNETVVAVLSNAGAGTINTATASATILDNDQSIWSLAGAGSVDEGAGTITYIVSRTGATNLTGTIVFDTAGGMATSGSDYTAVNQTLSFAAGETSKAVTVALNDDALAEGNETVVAVISNANGGSINTATATVTILDNDQSVWSLAGPSSSDEGAGALTYTVSRTGATNVSATIRVSTGALGTAAPGEDYEALNQVLTFGVGETRKAVTVKLIDDSIPEALDTFQLLLDNASTGSIATANAGLTLIDNDQSNWRVSNAGDVDEGAGWMTFVVTRTGMLPAANIQFATAGGTATAGADYTASNQVLNFAVGEASKTVTVAVTDDGVAEGSETVVAAISNANTGSILTATTSASILDNDQSNWSISGPGNVDEGARLLSYVVTRTGSSAAGATIEFATAGGTARASTLDVNGVVTVACDYTPVNQTLSFAVGETSKVVTVTVNDDTVAEPNETVLAAISNASAGTLGTATATATILDNDQTLWSVSFAGNVYEGAGFLAYTVSRTGPAPGATITFQTIGAPATANSDYSPLNTILTFAAGEMSKVVTTPILNDSIAELSEGTMGVISNPSAGTVAASVAPAGILEDDQTIWSIDGPGNVGEGGQFMVFTVHRETVGGAATGGAATIEVATVGGTATAGADYTAQHQTLTFAAGEFSKTFSVAITDDALREDSETVNAAISNATTGTIQNFIGTGTLLDNDQSIWSVASSASADESSPFLAYTVTRSGDASSAATLLFATAGGTATAGTDYTAFSQTLSFAAGEVSKTVKVLIADDAVGEANETVSVAIGNASTGTIATASATNTILDNDQSLWSVAFSNIGDPGEGGGGVLYTVSRTGGGSAATIDFATVGGTAIGGSDYTAQSPVVLSFATGEMSKSVVVAITDDTLAETVENIFVAIGNASSGSIATGTAGNNIYWDDQSLWYLNTLPSDEAAGLAEFFVLRLGSLGTAASIEFDVGGQTLAMAGADYTPVRQTLNFAVGEYGKTVYVPVINDVAGEIDETVTAAISNPSSGIVNLSTLSTTLPANDATRTNFSISATVASVWEDSGQAFYTITRSGDRSGSQTIEYFTSGGSATAGADYTAVSATAVTFAAGESTKVVSVNLLGDTIAEGSETLTVSLRNASGGAIVTSSASVTLMDNDTPAAATSYAISVPVNNVYESAGATAYTITRNGDVSAASTSYFRTNGGTATAGSDYTAVTGQTLSWGVGETSKLVFVTLTNDSAVESSETLVGQIATDSAFTLNSLTATTTILDDDTPGTGANAYTVAATASSWESTGLVHFTITRSGDLNITSNSYFRTNGGTATAGTDYTAVAGQTLTWSAAETTKIVTVNLIDDALGETTETITGQSATDSGFSVGATTANASVLDDDSQTMAAGVVDTLTTGTASGTYLGGTILDTGDMDDVVTIGTASTNNSVINLGAGNDTLNSGATQTNFFVNGAQYLGGAGVDTLALNTTTPFNFSTTASPGNFVKGFEIVSMAAAGNQTLNLGLADVLEFTSGNAVANTLRITGTAGDILNIQALGKTLSTLPAGTGNLTDVDGATYNVVASAAGNAAANDVSIGGQTYDVYQYQHSGQTLTMLINTLLTTSVV